MAIGSEPRLVTAGRTVTVTVAVALALAACGSSSSPSASGIGGGNGSVASGGNTALASGLAANLDKLTSYRFTWSSFGTGAGAGPTAAQTGSFQISGTVVNSPTRSIAVSYNGMSYVQIGTSLWSSFDGTSWYLADRSSGTDLTSMLPTSDYATWFDDNSTQFAAAGTEKKNGVDCIHFRGSDALGKLYGTVSGASASFTAELWVAKDGNYPVSGSFGLSANSAGAAGSFGYQFDITNIDDAANKIDVPTNVIALPS